MANNYEELVAEARSETEQTDVEAVRGALDSGEDVVVLDMWCPAEWDTGHIPEATPIPYGLLESRATGELPDKDARIVVHCASGGRGALAAKSLKDMGYTNAANMDGGINAWREKGYEVE